jgi:hypothetical protein
VDAENKLGMGIEPISIGEISLKPPFFDILSILHFFTGDVLPFVYAAEL